MAGKMKNVTVDKRDENGTAVGKEEVEVCVNITINRQGVDTYMLLREEEEPRINITKDGVHVFQPVEEDNKIDYDCEVKMFKNWTKM